MKLLATLYKLISDKNELRKIFGNASIKTFKKKNNPRKKYKGDQAKSKKNQVPNFFKGARP